MTRGPKSLPWALIPSLIEAWRSLEFRSFPG